MIIRKATPADIPEIQRVRNSVKENTLSNPDLVTDADVNDYITRRGSGWVCDVEDIIVGFAVADLQDNNIWALFIHPDFEGTGIGQKLHDEMLNWYFSQIETTVWLCTAPDTRAEIFYRKKGWIETGIHGKGEIKFEMKYQDWANRTEKNN